MLPPEFSAHIERAFETNNLTVFDYLEQHYLIIPLISGSKKIGYLVLNDAGEMEFNSREITIARNIKTQLTALMIRTWDYMEGIIIRDFIRIDHQAELPGRKNLIYAFLDEKLYALYTVDVGDIEQQVVPLAP